MEESQAQRKQGEERVDFTVKEGRFQRGEVQQAKMTSLGESMSRWVDSKSFQAVLESLSFTPSLARPEMG